MNLRDLPADAPLCTSGKRPFRTEDDARVALGNARRLRADRSGSRRRLGDVEAGFYSCTACGWWHLHSRNGRQTRGSIGARVDGNRRRR